MVARHREHVEQHFPLVNSDIELLKVSHACNPVEAFRSGFIPMTPCHSNFANKMPMPWPTDSCEDQEVVQSPELEGVSGVEERCGFLVDFAGHFEERRHIAWAPPALRFGFDEVHVSLEVYRLVLR